MNILLRKNIKFKIAKHGIQLEISIKNISLVCMRLGQQEETIYGDINLSIGGQHRGG